MDEAGQVALANLVAMSRSARNLVLLGDQMQLGQPIQGSHPGESGRSALAYWLDGQAVIPPDRGIFLKTSWRMHPRICDFVSAMVYDNRLQAEPSTALRVVKVPAGPSASALTPVSFLCQWCMTAILATAQKKPR